MRADDDPPDTPPPTKNRQNPPPKIRRFRDGEIRYACLACDFHRLARSFRGPDHTRAGEGHRRAKDRREADVCRLPRLRASARWLVARARVRRSRRKRADPAQEPCAKPRGRPALASARSPYLSKSSSAGGSNQLVSDMPPSTTIAAPVT